MNILQILIKHFDHFVKGIDFKNLPQQESEEYRALILKTANEQIFIDGKYSSITEWTVEFFDDEELQAGLRDLTMINSLTALQRAKLNFYIDLGQKTCYPLFRAKKIDWTQWPWNMSSSEDSMDNHDLFEFIVRGEHWCLSAAIIYYFSQLAWENEEFSSVARQDIVNTYEYRVKPDWKAEKLQTEEGMKHLRDCVERAADDIWEVENHLLVGKQLGFDQLTQAVYDAMDTFCDSMYRSRQIDFAREMAAWIKENWVMGERHPDEGKVKVLHDTLIDLMAKYNVDSPDFDFTWNILTLDELGMAMFNNENDNDTLRYENDTQGYDNDDDDGK